MLKGRPVRRNEMRCGLLFQPATDKTNVHHRETKSNRWAKLLDDRLGVYRVELPDGGEIMKKLCLAVGALVIGAGIYTSLPCSDLLFAQGGGCCKERRNLGARWKRNGMSLRDCTRLNQAKDGDNLEQASGFVWWDQRCR